MPDTIHVDTITVVRAKPAQATRRPVLFIPGYFATASVFAMWLPFFADRGAPAFAINLRGRAGSRPNVDLGRATIDDFVDDASAVARYLGKPVVVGHSMGGLIAQRLAERDTVHAAVLISPAPPRGISVMSPRLAITQLKYLPAIFQSKTVNPAREDLREIVLNRVPREMQDTILDGLVPDSGRAGKEMSITGVPVDRDRVRCPMLVVGSRDDRFIPVGIAERVARRYGAPIRILEGRGHMNILEPGWESLADSVDRWIREQG